MKQDATNVYDISFYCSSELPSALNLIEIHSRICIEYAPCLQNRRFALKGGTRRGRRFAQGKEGPSDGGSGTAASALLPLMTGPTGRCRLRRGDGLKHVSSAQCVHHFRKRSAKQIICLQQV
jgi:hypothetical protein